MKSSPSAVTSAVPLGRAGHVPSGAFMQGARFELAQDEPLEPVLRAQ